MLSPTGGLIEYVAGAYFYREDYGIDQAFDQGRDFCSPFVGNLFASYLASFNFSPQAANAIAGGVVRDCDGATQRDAVATRFRQDVSNYALYGQLTLNVTEQLRVTGGLRWTDSNKEGSFLSLINNPISAPPSPANPFALDLRIPEQHPDLEYDEEEITWLAEYQLFSRRKPDAVRHLWRPGSGRAASTLKASTPSPRPRVQTGCTIRKPWTISRLAPRAGCSITGW